MLKTQCVVFCLYLPWFGLTNVIIWKSQCNAENTCENGMCKRALTMAATITATTTILFFQFSLSSSVTFANLVERARQRNGFASSTSSTFVSSTQSLTTLASSTTSSTTTTEATETTTSTTTTTTEAPTTRQPNHEM
jgi:hypothetical protein